MLGLVHLYTFDGVDAELELVPLAARRALDHAGVKLSLEDWRALPLERRRELAQAGSQRAVDLERVRRALGASAGKPIPASGDPDAAAIPAPVVEAFGEMYPISLAVWLALSPLDRYALAKVAARGNPERLRAAHAEIVGQSAVSTHLAPSGGARMVGITDKAPSLRRALAESRVTLGAAAFERLATGNTPKGDVLGTARIAGLMAAKRTSELVPLCHPIALTRLDVRLELEPVAQVVRIIAEVEAFDRTGVEMEAMTAVSVAALTVYDMLKGVDRGIELGPTRLLEKSGGRTGEFRR
jgi:cyclic pyranopterin phosphate synthase